MSNRSSARLEAGRKRKRIATSTRFMEISPGSAEMRLGRTTQCSRLRHCGYIVDVLSANLSLGLCQGCRQSGAIAILPADLTGRNPSAGQQKLKMLHQQSDYAGDQERCGPYRVEIQPGLA